MVESHEKKLPLLVKEPIRVRRLQGELRPNPDHRCPSRAGVRGQVLWRQDSRQSEARVLVNVPTHDHVLLPDEKQRLVPPPLSPVDHQRGRRTISTL